MATDFVEKMANFPHLSLWHSETEWDIATSTVHLFLCLKLHGHQIFTRCTEIIADYFAKIKIAIF